MKKSILMLTTGGTISSRESEEGLVPSGADEILAHIGSAAEQVLLDTRELLTLDSANIQPEEWRIIAGAVFEGFGRYDGIVVTHGTDTMAYTSSAVSFMLRNPPVPVVFTGSQLPISSPLTDATLNLRRAFAMAQSGHSGVFVVFDRKVILGARAVKVRTRGFDAFDSINCDCAGVFTGKGLTVNENVLVKPDGPPKLCDDLDTNVFLLKLTPGMNPDIIDRLIASGCSGLVLETFGLGGVQLIRRDFIAALERANVLSIPVVACSQCLYEAPDFSLYQPGRLILKAGVINGRDMTIEAAVTKLMWALGQTRDREEIRGTFETDLAGEVTV